MKFKLVYFGDVPPNGNRQAAQARDKMRFAFHNQLKALWSQHKALQALKYCPCDVCQAESREFGSAASHSGFAGGHGGAIPYVEHASTLYKNSTLGIAFVPLVTARLSLSCQAEILLLSNPRREGVGHMGDLDNRIKVIIDALQMPQSRQGITGDFCAYATRESHLFCVLEDDRLITSIRTEADTLLYRKKGSRERSSGVLISLEVKPITPTLFNMAFS
jgi:hypothetical protein